MSENNNGTTVLRQTTDLLRQNTCNYCCRIFSAFHFVGFCPYELRPVALSHTQDALSVTGGVIPDDMKPTNDIR